MTFMLLIRVICFIWLVLSASIATATDASYHFVAKIAEILVFLCA